MGFDFDRFAADEVNVSGGTRVYGLADDRDGFLLNRMMRNYRGIVSRERYVFDGMELFFVIKIKSKILNQIETLNSYINSNHIIYIFMIYTKNMCFFYSKLYIQLNAKCNDSKTLRSHAGLPQ